MVNEATNGFSDYKELLLSELRRLSNSVLDLQKEVKNLALSVEHLRIIEKIIFILLGATGSGLIGIVTYLVKKLN